MDLSHAGHRNVERRGGGRLKAQRIPPPNPQLFEDTSMQQNTYGYPPPGTDYSAPFASLSAPGPFNDYGPPVGGGYGMGGSSYGGGPQGHAAGPPSMMAPAFPGQHLLNDPMANMAMQYGHTLAGQGSEYMTKNEQLLSPMKRNVAQFSDDVSRARPTGKQEKEVIEYCKVYSIQLPPSPPRMTLLVKGEYRTYLANLEKYKYFATNKLKYYFAVDTVYVCKKLGLVVFPFAHKDWSLSYNEDEPSAPRYNVNAPDLYIPVMAFVTYILLAGISLGTQNRFSPEQLGLTASSALVWTILEILLLLLTMYIVNLSTGLKYLDLLAYCGYKYVGMIIVIAASLVFESQGYYAALGWTGFSLAFFLVRSLKLAIVPRVDAAGGHSFEGGNKRRLYMLVMIALTQPLLIWWLTRHLARGSATIV